MGWCLKKITRIWNEESRVGRAKTKIKRTLVFLGTIILIGVANANPVLNNVASGNVTVQQSTGVTQVNQSSQQAIINWKSFNIGAKEATHFIQPTGGIALNRIDPSQGASQIFGLLTATGKIVLVNQAGIYFGPGSVVDVGGIIASTSNISDQNFLAGKYIFDQASPYSGSIVNQGSIIAQQHGLVALVGTSVSNEGFISANLGQVVLASGNKFTVDLSGDQLINFSIDEGASSPGVSPVDGSKMKNAINNSGSVIANGGKILMSAAAAQGVLDNVINMSGVAQAQSVAQQNGEIILSADPNVGTVQVSGKLDASGKASGQTGGRVKVLGANVKLNSPAVVDVSGDQGGGTILIGGNFHGAGPEPNASTTFIGSGVLLNADAITKGNGGQVAVWSNNATQFYGSISAKGGAQGGNGGYVETSGGYLDINGASVNTLAPAGQTGTWLLDPTDITISSSSDSNATYLNGTYQPTSGASSSSTILVSNLVADLASNNVLVTTSPFSGSGGAGSGNITVSSAINWSSATTLTLSAYNNITINAAISNSAGGGLTLLADNTGKGTGTINGLGANGSSGTVSLTGNNSVFKAYYDPITFGTQDPSILANVTVSGTGSSNTAYMLVNSQTNLQAITSHLSGNFALGTNLTLSGSFTPIGSSGTPFTGKFDGQNYYISNLSINGGGGTDIGFFAATNGATIQNLIFTNSFVQTAGGTNVATLIGLMTGGSVSNVHVIESAIPTIGYVPNCPACVPTYGVYDSLGGAIIGGLIGDTSGSSTISNSSYSGAVINSGNNFTGGLVSLLNASGTITNSYTAGLVENGANAANNLGGITGELNGGTISNSYSIAKIANETVSDTTAGGITGSTGSTATIQNTYWAGTYTTSAGTSNNFGGIVGSRGGSPTISNSYWDTTLSGMSNGVGGGGSQTGTTGETTSALQGSLLTGFSSPTWAIIAGNVYPYLQSQTLGIYGTITGNSGATVNIATNGAVLDGTNAVNQSLRTTTATNGTYYYLLNNFYVPSSTPLLLYSTSSAGSSTALAILANDSNPANINLAANTLDIHAPSATATNSLLGVEKGSLSSSNILYSTSGANLTVSGTAAFTTESTTTYNADGTLTGTSGAMTFNGPLIVTGGTITSTGSQSYNNTVTLNANTSLTAGTTMYFGGAVSGPSYSLTLSAESAATSASGITTGASGTINVGTFDLAQGGWSQVGTLPSFSANNFILASPAGTTVQFLRATGGTGGTGVNAYQITDVYGLQGIGSSTTLLADSFQLVNNIDASGTQFWNSGVGFVPIGNSTTNFTGGFDGQSKVISGLYINQPSSSSDVGLFGYVAIPVSTSFSNIGLTGATIVGGSSIGGLAGVIVGSGSAANNYITNSTVTSIGTGKTGIGGLYGGVWTAITNSYSTANVTAGNSASDVGGFVGDGIGTYQNSYSTGSVITGTGATAVGGFIGYSTGNLAYVYSSSPVTVGAGSTEIGGLLGYNGCCAAYLSVLGAYSTGSIAAPSSSNIGGLIGENDIGGAIGLPGTVTSTYSTSSIYAPLSTNIGGLIGLNNSGAITKSFWDINTTGQSQAVGSNLGTITSPVTGLTTAQTTSYSSVESIFGNSQDPANVSVATNVLPTGGIYSTPSTGAVPSYTWFMFDGETRPILIAELATPGTAVTPGVTTFTISTAHQLQLAGTTLDANYTLANNINLSSGLTNLADVWATNSSLAGVGTGFVPIGNSSNGTIYNYSGTFNGASNTISNLYENIAVAPSVTTDIGLFGDTTGTIEYVNLTGETINAGISANIGGVVGEMTGGTLTNVSTAGTLSLINNPTGASAQNIGIDMGGLVGTIRGGTVSNSYTTATINATSDNLSNSLGLIVGGAIGYISAAGATVTGNYSAGSVNVNAVGTGGSAAQLFVGGFLGYANSAGSLSTNFSITPVSVTSSGATQAAVGGFVGWENSTTALTQAYSTGLVTTSLSNTGFQDVGGFVGLIGSNATINKDLWDVKTSGQTAGYGANSGTVTPTTGLLGGCFGSQCGSGTAVTNASNSGTGTGTSGGSYDLSTITPYSNAGWSITSSVSSGNVPNNTWFIFSGQTRPLPVALLANPGTTVTSGVTTFTISTPYQLQLAGTTLDANYTLANNINLSSGMTNAADVWGTNATTGAGFVPIGNSSSGYSGTFNGAGYTISNLYENVTSNINSDIGLFGDVSTGTVKNVNLSGENINVGINSGTWAVGGLIGNVTGAATITSDTTAGTISLSNNPTGTLYIGGLIGEMINGTLTNSYNTDAITANSNAVSSSGGFYIGGAVGNLTANGLTNWGTATNDYSAGSITATVTSASGTPALYVGGLFGNFQGVANTDYSLTSINITATNMTNNIGGFVGLQNSIITGLDKSYSSGSVTTSITGGSSAVGGFAGSVIDTAGVTNSLWDIISSGQSAGVGSFVGGSGLSSTTIYGGCFGGNCGTYNITTGTASNPGSSSAVNLSGYLASGGTVTTSPYNTLGWSITSTPSTTSSAPSNTWFIFTGQTRPILLSEWSTSITNAHQLQLMGAALGASYTLSGNIDLTDTATSAGTLTATQIAAAKADIWGYSSGQGFVSVGSGSGTSAFTGNFNGEGYTISNLNEALSLSNTGTYYSGLFGYVGGSGYAGEIQNVTLSNPTLSATYSGTNTISLYQGGIAGYLRALDPDFIAINNVTLSGGTLNGGGFATNFLTDAGGIVGALAEGSIWNATDRNALIENDEENYGYNGASGGIVGVAGSAGAVNIGYSTSSASLSSSVYLGGILGTILGNSVTIFNSSNSGTANANGEMGGLVSDANTYNLTIYNSYNTGTMETPDNGESGGLVDAVEGTTSIYNSYNTGTVQGSFAGGMVGVSLGTVILQNDYNSGSITQKLAGSRLGGLIGEAEGNGTAGTITITNSYNVGSIANGTGGSGGLIGVVGSAGSGAAYAANVTVNSTYNSGSMAGGHSSTSGALFGIVSTPSTIKFTGGGENFWDTTTTGIADSGTPGTNAFGANTGTITGSDTGTITTSNYSGQTLSTLLTTTSYTNNGWSVGTANGSTWYQINNTTRPILESEYSTNIVNAHQLQLINLDLSANYTLGSSVTASNTAASNSTDVWAGNTFNPLGNFLGSFNGNNYAINNLTITNSTNGSVGFFSAIGNVNYHGSIQNLGFTNPTINYTGGSAYIGVLAGSSIASAMTNIILNNVYVNGGSVSGTTTNSDAGGLIGLMGLSGYGGTISNSYNSGTSVAAGLHDGGLVGGAANIILENDFNSGKVTSNASGGNPGGLIGDINTGGSIINSFNAGSVGGATNWVGGLAGFSSNITYFNTYNLGEVSSTSSSNIGGLIGQSTSDTILNSYNAGLVSGSGSLGGLIGSESGSTVTNSYWDTSTSGQSTSAGNLGSGKTTNYLQTTSLATLGFSSSTWGGAGSTNMYPYLLNFYTSTPTVVSGIMCPSGTCTGGAAAGSTVQLVDQGTPLTTGATSLTNSTLGTMTTGANGYYYFIESNGVLTNNTDVLTYVTGGAQNDVGLISSGAANNFATSVAANTLNVESSITSNTGVVNAVGSLNTNATYSSGILYGTSGSNNISILSTDNLNVAGAYTINGTITSATSLNPITTGGNLGNVTFNGATTINTGTGISLNAGSNTITFGSTLDGQAASTYSFASTGSGNVIFGGVVGAGAALSSIGITGTTAINTTGITTSGAQTYTGAATLGANTTLTSSAGGITFSNTLNGPDSLTIASGSGTIIFGGLVGGSSALSSLAINGTSNPTDINGGGVTTSGNQSYGSTITLGAGAVLNTGASGSNSISLAAVSLGSNNLTLTTAGSASQSGIISGTGGSLTVNGAGIVTLSQQNTYTGGTTMSAGTLNVTVNSNSGPITQGPIGTGSLNLNGGILETTNGSGVTIANIIALDSTSAGGVTATIGGSDNLTLNGSINMNATKTTDTLDVTNTGITTFGAALSGVGALNQSAGTLIAAGNSSTYTGAVTLSGSSSNLEANNASNPFG
ncbi:MAG: filamentous hemagglutinin N-terminal domain-containing protein, partial [Gammaproteobacteria bacterium]